MLRNPSDIRSEPTIRRKPLYRSEPIKGRNPFYRSEPTKKRGNHYTEANEVEIAKEIKKYLDYKRRIK